MLIRSGADLNARTNDRLTPLHLAVIKGNQNAHPKRLLIRINPDRFYM